MRTIQAQTFVTLDGVMQAPGGPEEDTSGGFRHGGWSQPYWDDMMGGVMAEAMEQDYDLLLGRRTYDIFAAHWPNAGEDNPVTQKFNRATKYVVTSAPETLGWENSRPIVGDVAGGVAELKQEDGPPLSVQGSSRLLQTLLENGLVDDLFVWTFPVVLGGGKRLFGEGTVPLGLELTELKHSATGVTIANYRAAGAVETGSFALENSR